MVPPVRPLRPPVVGALGAAAGVIGAHAVRDDSESLEPELLERIDEALAECADQARAEVMSATSEAGGRRPRNATRR